MIRNVKHCFQGAQSERQDDSSSASSNADCHPARGAAQEGEGKSAAFASDDYGGFDGVDDDGGCGDDGNGNGDDDEEDFDQRTMNCNEQFFPRNPGKVLIAKPDVY